MRWEAWVLVALFVLGALSGIGTIGKPRTPNTPGFVVVLVLCQAACVWLVLRLAGVA